jgi:hypothetical protein
MEPAALPAVEKNDDRLQVACIRNKSCVPSLMPAVFNSCLWVTRHVFLINSCLPELHPHYLNACRGARGTMRGYGTTSSKVLQHLQEVDVNK